MRKPLLQFPRNSSSRLLFRFRWVRVLLSLGVFHRDALRIWHFRFAEFSDIEIDVASEVIPGGAEIGSGNGRGVFGMAGYRDGDVVRVGQDSPAGIESDPAGAGQVDFRPAVHGHSSGDAGSIHVAADKSRGQAQKSAGLHEQGGKIPAGAAHALDGLSGRLHAT